MCNLIGLAIPSTATIVRAFEVQVFVPIKDLRAGEPRNTELTAEGGLFLAFQQSSYESKTLIHLIPCPPCLQLTPLFVDYCIDDDLPPCLENFTMSQAITVLISVATPQALLSLRMAPAWRLNQEYGTRSQISTSACAYRYDGATISSRFLTIGLRRCLTKKLLRP